MVGVHLHGPHPPREAQPEGRPLAPWHLVVVVVVVVGMTVMVVTMIMVVLVIVVVKIIMSSHRCPSPPPVLTV